MTKNGKITTSSFGDGNLITCFSNDYGFENWIQNTIKYYSSKKDLVILLSASGTSRNIIKAAKYCNKNKINCASIYGFNKKIFYQSIVELIFGLTPNHIILLKLHKLLYF